MIFNNNERGRSKDLTMNMVRVLARHKKGFKIVHINAQSLNNKVDEFKIVFENSDVDVICVSETWLVESTPDSIICPNGYKIFRADRGSLGGGVAIFVKRGICCKICHNFSYTSRSIEQDVEFTFIEISSLGKKLLVGCVYRPHKRISFTTLYSTLETLASVYDDIVITGDFNSDLLVESTLSENMLSLGLFPVNVISPTHHTSTTSTLIDLFFVSNTASIILYDQISASCFSKHDLIFLTYNFRIQQIEECYSYRDFKTLNLNLLCEYSSNIAWSDIYFMSSVNDQSLFLEHNIKYLFDLTVPLKHKKTTYKQKPWFTNAIKNAINLRDLAYARWKRFKTVEFKLQYSIARKNVNGQIRQAKTEYYSKRFSSAIDSKQTWNTIREIGIGKVNKNDCQADANTLNTMFANIPLIQANPNFLNFSPTVLDTRIGEHFYFSCVTHYDIITTCNSIKSNAVGIDNIHPKFLRLLMPLILPYVAHLFNTIIMSSIYPLNWKHAKIVPLPKSNGEYRPIAVLCFLSKVLEKLLHKQMIKYINTHNLLSVTQSGFRKSHSCVTALVEVSENIRQGLENGKINFLVLLDHSKAFDTVDHEMLIKKLKNLFSFSTTSTKLLFSYLSNRAQSVYVNDIWSDSLSLTRGVPQGSILGPLLFSLYINDLPNQLSKCKIHLYADDVQLILSSPVQNMALGIASLNEDLQKIHLWASANGLCLNPRKSKCIVICKRSLNPSVCADIVINGEKIEIVTAAKNLGIIFNSNLTWNDHINSLAGQTYIKLRALWSTQYFTPFRVRILLAKTYLVPSLIYGCELFGSCDSVSKRKLNILFNNIIRYVYGLKRFDHVSSAAKNLYGISFESLLKTRILIFLHKIINTKTPKYLYDRICFSQSPRNRNIVIPLHQCLVSEWQFFIHGARLWNTLPQNQQLNSNANSFKSFLFNFYT